MPFLTAIRTAPLWASFLFAGALLTSLYVFVPPFAGSGPVMNLLGLAPVVAIAVGVRRYKPRARAAWWCLGLGQTLFWLGDLYTYSYPKLLDKEVPFPSAGDALFVGDRLETDVRGAHALGMTTVQALWFHADEAVDGVQPDYEAFTQMDVLNIVERLRQADAPL